jgi:ketopantoate reductase
MTEVAAVAWAAGNNLTEADVDAALKVIRSFPTHATTSLQCDLELGRKSEYRALTEAVLLLALSHSDVTP